MSEFWDKVTFTTDCWEWNNSKTKDGYGQFYFVKSVKAHRFAYELYNGKIQNGLELDHLCRNRSCVNPSHLEAVTHKENIMRGVGICSVNAKKIDCHRGHELTPENTFISKIGSRNCKACLKIRNDLRPRKTEGKRHHR